MASDPNVQPVSLYAEDPRLPRTLLKSLQQEIDKRRAVVASGVCKDFADYRQRVGEIQGLEIAAGICQELEKNLSGS